MFRLPRGSRPCGLCGLRRLAVAGLMITLLTAASGARADASAETRADGAPPDSPPVLLRDSLLLTPIEAAGSGVAPEVDVRLTVDRQGRVARVEVLSIKPSSAYDDAFRQAVEETLGSWRYAPAWKDGETVESTLRWTIKFQEKAGLPPSGTSDLGPMFESASSLEQIFTLPFDQQAKYLKHLASLAEPYLDTSHRRRADSARFVVISDAPDAGTAETLARNLEAVFTLLDQTFQPDVPPYPDHYKLVVYVYWKSASFSALVSQVGAAEWANGFYAAPGFLAFHLETGDVDDLLGLMVHEAVHAYMDRYLDRPGFRPPPWLAEGFASYFGKSEIHKGHLVLGSVREGKYVIDQRLRGAFRWKTQAGWTLGDVRLAVRKGTVATPADLLAMNRETFYGGDVTLHYALSWLLVHFLRHGEPGWADEQFPTLVLYLTEGYPAAAALETVYGLSPQELNRPFQEYVRTF